MGVSDERRVSNAGTALSHHSNGTGMSHHSNGGSFDLPPAAAPDGPEPAIYSRSSGGSMKCKRKASLAREGGEVLRWRGKSMKSMGSMNSLAMHGSEAHEDLMDLQPGDALPWLGHDLPMFVPNLDVGDVVSHRFQRRFIPYSRVLCIRILVIVHAQRAGTNVLPIANLRRRWSR